METFFQNSSILDEIEVKELLLHRYSNIEYIMNMDIYEGTLFVNKAIEKDQEDKLYDVWLQKINYMTKENYMSFEQFMDVVKQKHVDNRPLDELLEEIDEIEKQFERR